jgi:predicted phage tail protein
VSNVTAYTHSTALADGSHTFSVRAKDAVANTGSAASLEFIIDTIAPATPALVSPEDGAQLNDTTPAFDWGDVSDPSGVSYNLQIDDNSDFSSPVLNREGLTTSQYELTSGESLDKGTYYWRVRAVDGAANESGWSSTFSFKLPWWLIIDKLPWWLIIVAVVAALLTLSIASRLLRRRS